MKTGLKWVAGILFLGAGLATIFQGGVAIITGILFFLVGLICLPPTLILIETKLKTNFSRPLKYSLVIGLWIVGAALFPKDGIKENNVSTPKSEAKVVKKSEPENVTPSATEKMETVSEETKLKEQLLREIKSFEKPFNSDTYSGDVTSLQMELAVFGAWAIVIENGKNSIDPENNKLAVQLEKKAQTLQIREFPKLRKKYGVVAGAQLWENDVDVKVDGVNNSTITFVNRMFAANKNKADAQKAIQDVLTQFRFKRSQYKWYKYDDEYTYYKMDTPKDGEPVTF